MFVRILTHIQKKILGDVQMCLICKINKSVKNPLPLRVGIELEMDVEKNGRSNYHIGYGTLCNQMWSRYYPDGTPISEFVTAPATTPANLLLAIKQIIKFGYENIQWDALKTYHRVERSSNHYHVSMTNTTMTQRLTTDNLSKYKNFAIELCRLQPFLANISTNTPYSIFLSYRFNPRNLYNTITSIRWINNTFNTISNFGYNGHSYTSISPSHNNHVEIRMFDTQIHPIVNLALYVLLNAIYIKKIQKYQSITKLASNKLIKANTLKSTEIDKEYTFNNGYFQNETKLKINGRLYSREIYNYSIIKYYENEINDILNKQPTILRYLIKKTIDLMSIGMPLSQFLPRIDYDEGYGIKRHLEDQTEDFLHPISTFKTLLNVLDVESFDIEKKQEQLEQRLVKINPKINYKQIFNDCLISNIENDENDELTITNEVLKTTEEQFLHKISEVASISLSEAKHRARTKIFTITQRINDNYINIVYKKRKIFVMKGEL